MKGKWQLVGNSNISGKVTPLEVGFVPLFQTCSVTTLQTQRSSFKRRSANDSTCIHPDAYPAWEKAIIPYVTEYYDSEHLFDRRDPSHSQMARTYGLPLADFSSYVVTGNLIAGLWDHTYYIPDSVQVVPIGAPEFPPHWPEVHALVIPHAEWALSQAFVGPVHGEPDLGKLEQELWFRLPGQKWKHYDPCNYDNFDKVCQGNLSEDEIGNEIIATIGTAGLGFFWNSGKKTVTWMARQYVGQQLTEETGVSLATLVSREFVDDLVRVAACERGSLVLLPEQPVVELVGGLPKQLYRQNIDIGPAYRTFEEAAAAAQHLVSGKLRKGHVLRVRIRGRDGSVIGEWFESSSRNIGSTSEGLALGHTEQKALLRIREREGVRVEFTEGSLHPCTRPDGCLATLDGYAKETGMNFVYRVINRSGRNETIYEFLGDGGVVVHGTDVFNYLRR